LGDIERADAMVSKALAIDPNYANAHLIKAFTLERQRRVGEALAEDERALALNPAWPAAYVNMGLVYRTLDALKKASDSSIRRSDKAQMTQIWLFRTRLKRAIISG
jgi:tetratricopeptide (TPR) repeat protein